MLPYQISKNTIIVVIDGVPHTVSATTSTTQYQEVREAIKEERWTDVRHLVLTPVARAVSTFQSTTKALGHRVEIINGEVLYQGYPVRSAVTQKILELYHEGFGLEPLLNYLDREQRNPEIRAREELWGFIEANNFTIDAQGFILAYRAVTGDFKDIHSRTFDNSPGKTVEMPREQVCADKHRTCAEGLHFANYDYAHNAYGGNAPRNRLILVKIDPADVVSIPTDYKNGKGRCCRYTVVQEIETKEPLETTTVDLEPDFVPKNDYYSSYSPDYDDDEDWDDEWDDEDWDEEEEFVANTTVDTPQNATVSQGATGDKSLDVLLNDINASYGGLHSAPEDVKKTVVEKALDTSQGVVEGASGAATLLGVAGSTFRGWIKKLGVSPR